MTDVLNTLPDALPGELRERAPKPMPRGRQLGERIPRPPQPLFRGTMTFTLPSNTMFSEQAPVTVEVIILAEAVHEDDVTATREDVPELNQAGWIASALGPMVVYMRSIM